MNMGEYALNAKSTEVLFVNMGENAFIAKSAEVLQFVNMGDDRHEAKSVEDHFFFCEHGRQRSKFINKFTRY